MLRFSIFGFPVGVEWWFWLVAALLGGLIGADTASELSRVAIWVLVVFVSILVHELGHAVAGRRYGAHPAIKLHGFGGVTLLHGARFSRRESILVSGAGPLFGFALGAVLLVVGRSAGTESSFVNAVVFYGVLINFFWTVINLLPIQPLDGGQILREILGPRRLVLTYRIGAVCAAGTCVWAVSERRIFLALLLGMLAYHNWRGDETEGGTISR